MALGIFICKPPRSFGNVKRTVDVFGNICQASLLHLTEAAVSFLKSFSGQIITGPEKARRGARVQSISLIPFSIERSLFLRRKQAISVIPSITYLLWAVLSSQTPAKGKDPPTNKGGRDTANNPHIHSQKPLQGHGTCRAKEGKHQHVDDSLAPTVAIPFQGASWGANAQKSRDLGIEDTGQMATGLLPQTGTDFGSSSTGELHSQDREAHTPRPPDIIPTNQDPVLITTDSIHPPPRQEDFTEPIHQAGLEMDRSPTGNERLCLYVRVGDTPDHPDKGPTNTDPERPSSKNRQTQTRQKARSALNKTGPPPHHIPEHPATPTNTGGRLPGPAAQERDGLILDSNSMTSGCTEVDQTTSSATGMQRQEQSLEKRVTHATDTATLLSDGAKTAQPGILEPTTAETKDNEPEPTLTPAVQYVLKNRQRRQARAQVQAKSSTACFALGTPILVEILGKASWQPIYLAGKGDIAVQTLPSRKN